MNTKLRQQQIEQNQLESLIVNAERELIALISEVKSRRGSKKLIKSFLEQKVREFPDSVPLLCNKVLAEFPEDEILELEYLHNCIINSYNVRIEMGDKNAATLLDYFLRSIGRKQDVV